MKIVSWAALTIACAALVINILLLSSLAVRVDKLEQEEPLNSQERSAIQAIARQEIENREREVIAELKAGLEEISVEINRMLSEYEPPEFEIPEFPEIELPEPIEIPEIELPELAFPQE